MPNRLAASSSPYLLQHQDNPVDWYEWGEEAFTAAAERQVPVLLSVGYATCHWCHVMAHESFEDAATADYMNAHFVNVKVDREERPDVDRVYMDAVQAMTGRGGWPMTVFLTPGGEPFFAGTYFPKAAQGHHPSFLQVMTSVTDAWRDRRSDLHEQAARLTAAVTAGVPPGDVTLTPAVIDRALGDMIGRVDWEYGGFGGAPKFPQAPNLELALRALALDAAGPRSEQLASMLTTTLDRMATGGIYDHLGGGFSRYSVDRRWLVPHFEKMLYDNALLARLYLRAAQVTGESAYQRVATETLDYLLRDLLDPGGGLYSGEDADSEGEEGKFYVWSWDELEDVLGPDVHLAAAAFGASREGNFEGMNVLHRPISILHLAERFDMPARDVGEALNLSSARLLARRIGRIRPSVDDKIVTAWNGLALRSLAEAGAVLGESRFLDAARRLADFAATQLFTETGRLVRTWRQGVQGPPAFCDDYAALAVGMFTLYQTTGEVRWWNLARRLVLDALDLFAAADGGFYATGHDVPQLIARPMNLMDNPTPSDNALMAEALTMLAAYTGEPAMRTAIDGIYRAAGTLIEQYPAAVGQVLAVGLVGIDGPKEVAIVGDEPAMTGLTGVVWERFRPDCVLAAGAGSDSIPLLRDRKAPQGEARAFVCREFVCAVPVSSADSLRAQLDSR
ncbi:MAG TPA: thioredoxin domain-containing protein [Acidimicrobiia bacterium]|nr:thioredoxin domain-containing protein [Acidimicrobiia bacterium]